jgi:mono/diheme cytochrome c family protein
MPAWRQLEKTDLEDVTSYVQLLQAQAVHLQMSPVDAAAAKTIYAANCVSCHGTTGQGNGPAAGALKPSPVNFHVRQPTTERAWTVLRDGVPGSAMPSWKSNLTEDERRLLIPYIQQMYGTEAKEPQQP